MPGRLLRQTTRPPNSSTRGAKTPGRSRQMTDTLCPRAWPSRTWFTTLRSRPPTSKDRTTCATLKGAGSMTVDSIAQEFLPGRRLVFESSCGARQEMLAETGAKMAEQSALLLDELTLGLGRMADAADHRILYATYGVR